QAEDGIRDRNVTGVQTCALPIYGAVADLVVERVDAGGAHAHEQIARARLGSRHFHHFHPCLVTTNGQRFHHCPNRSSTARSTIRSEERRVGKEWRYGVWQ